MRPSVRYLASKVVRKVASVPAEFALGMMRSDFVEERLLRPRYEAALREHAARLPSLDQTEARIVADLERTGVGASSLDELATPGGVGFLAAARAIASELAGRAAARENRGRHTLQADAAQLIRHPEVFRWGLAERLLRIIECYLGLPVAYDGLSYYHSVADGNEAGPREWHRDREDRKMIKVCVYVTDVGDEDDGPFECLLPEVNALVPEGGGFRYKNLGHAELTRALPPGVAAGRTTCLGPAGSVFFTDTARYYHRGRPPIRSDRSAIFFGYFARPPRHPFLCGRTPLSRRQIARLVEGLAPEPREVALWHREVPPPLRWVPKNRVQV